LLGQSFAVPFLLLLLPLLLLLMMERIGLSGELWSDVVNRFGKIFKRVAGTPETLAQEAMLRGAKWLPNGKFAIAKCRLAILSRAS